MRAHLYSILIVVFALNLPVSADITSIEGFTGGEAIHRVSLVDPLGESGFHFDLKAQFLQLELDTSTFDLRFSMSYGLFPGCDFALHLPYMRMSNGPDRKFGPGDALVSFKFARQKSIQRIFNWGLQASLMVPSGYQKEVNGFPTFSHDEFGYGGRYLLQLDSRKIRLVGNVGGFFTISGDKKDLFYGFGTQVNILKRLLMCSGEFTSTQNLGGGEPASFAYFGASSHLPFIGLGLHLGAEAKLGEDLPLKLVIGASLTSRKTVPGVSKGILDTKGRYRKLMVFEFIEEQEGFVEEEVKERFCRQLGSLEDITILDPPAKVSLEDASRDRERALAAAEGSGADLVVFARYHRSGYDDKCGFTIPYLLGFPRTIAYIAADLWVVDTQSKEQIYRGQITGKASRLRGAVLFPSNCKYETYCLDVKQKEEIRSQAVDRFIKNMSLVFSDRLK